MTEVFTGSFTQQDPLPPAAIEAANAVMRSGRLHRYNLTEGEVGEAALLESEFAAFAGARHCVAVASGGQAMAIALRATGVALGTPVLTNAFTLAPVPGAIAAVGAQPVFVGTTEALTIDLDDLAAKIATTRARHLLLSHMRGHIADMDALMTICDGAGVTVIEDCAHTMGADWNGTPSGRHGALACYSTQTYKHINSGEGGLLTTDDPDLAAKAVLMSGSYMLYAHHGTAPAREVFEAHRYDTPNMSARMDHLRAAILRPQIPLLPERRAAWNALYAAVEDGLRGLNQLALIDRDPREGFVASSIQWRLPEWPAAAIEALIAACATRGVALKWFGAATPTGFTSRHSHWHYANPEPLPRTEAILSTLIDMRLPLTFTTEGAALIARIIADEVRNHTPPQPHH
ncbi:MAG: aminotransferase class I/II-fold pyridoxal phosphate-dependent enzyme [Rhodobacteraceae bacterium]|nr:aminotransferase class I/II-fold pyridoxal phosphate-dependent enzyme [Paracoccaceae bacterium]